MKSRRSLASSSTGRDVAPARASHGARAKARTFGALASLAAILASCDGTSPASSSTPGAPEAAPSPAGRHVRLARGAHPLARPSADLGRLPAETRLRNLSVVFKPTAQQRRERDALRDAQLDPKSPSFRAWLTTEQYATRFGARPEDVARTAAWLRGQGLEVHGASPLGSRVTFSGSAAQIEATFQSELHRYRAGGEVHFAMSSGPAIPAELADVILAVRNTHDFRPKPHVRRPSPRPGFKDPTAGLGLAPADWAAVYDVSTLYAPGLGGRLLDGTGVSIAVVGTAGVAQSDLDAFRSTFGLTARTVSMELVPNTGAPGPGTNGTGTEAILDLEWAGGIAKGADVHYYFVGADDPNVDDAVLFAIEQNAAAVLSESFGICEYALTPADADVFEVYGTAANLLGMTYLASSGDAGAAGCLALASLGYPDLGGLYVEVPASYPGVTGVGGTQLPSVPWSALGAATGYDVGERVWSTSSDASNAIAGGGGISIAFARPSYQRDVPTCAILGALPTSVAPADMRQVPDVAFSASASIAPYFIECTFDPTSGDCARSGGDPAVYAVGGTSAAAPAFAGVVALASQAAGARLGNVNPLLYALRGSQPGVFHDIATGDNAIGCAPATDPGCPAGAFYGYAASAGYDCATGLGSLDAAAFVGAIVGLVPTATTLSAAPPQTSEGASVTLTATVAAVGADPRPLTGTVTFSFRSYTTTGAPDLAWELGASALTVGAGGDATATLTTTIPPGVGNPGNQSVDLVATYGGDATHRPSVSARLAEQFEPIDFAIAPSSPLLNVGDPLALATTGGVPPIRWYIYKDGTCDASSCSSLDLASGAFLAGPRSGTVRIEAFDAFGAEAVAIATVHRPGDAPDAGKDAGAPETGATDAATVGDDEGRYALWHRPENVGCHCSSAVTARSDDGARGAWLGDLTLSLLSLLSLRALRRRARRELRDAPPRG